MTIIDSACEWLGNHPYISAALLIVGSVLFCGFLVWGFVAKIEVAEPDEHSKYPGIG